MCGYPREKMTIPETNRTVFMEKRVLLLMMPMLQNAFSKGNRPFGSAADPGGQSNNGLKYVCRLV
jgi:hypothetical protein